MNFLKVLFLVVLDHGDLKINDRSVDNYKRYFVYVHNITDFLKVMLCCELFRVFFYNNGAENLNGADSQTNSIVFI